jgi:hypothetical protein
VPAEQPSGALGELPGAATVVTMHRAAHDGRSDRGRRIVIRRPEGLRAAGARARAPTPRLPPSDRQVALPSRRRRRAGGALATSGGSVIESERPPGLEALGLSPALLANFLFVPVEDPRRRRVLRDGQWSIFRTGSDLRP